MTPLTKLLLLSTLGSIIALVGGVIFLAIKKWNKALAKYSVPFAAGVLITTAIIGLLPEAVHMYGDRAYLILLAAFIGSYIFESFFCDLHHHEHDHEHQCAGKGSTTLVVVGDSIHNFVDGVAIAGSFMVNPGLGLVTAISTFLHEVPHEIGDFGILLKNGLSNKKVFLINFLSSLTTILGSLFVWFLLPSTQFSGALLAIAAGMFLYLGASDFLPKVNKGAFKTTIIMLLGAVLMYLTLNAIPHSHDHEEGHGHGHEKIESIDDHNLDHDDDHLEDKHGYEEESEEHLKEYDKDHDHY